MSRSLFHPSENSHWTSTQWKTVERTIAKLQHRIAKATLDGKGRKVRNLQRLLVKSLSARLKAVKQVAGENTSKATPGIDGELWTTPKQKLEAVFLLRRRIKSKPLRRIDVPGKENSVGSRGIPVLLDRARQALWNLAVTPCVESSSTLVSSGFRLHPRRQDVHAHIKLLLSPRNSPSWILESDIRNSFDTLNHDWLLKNTPMERKVLKSWLKGGFLKSSGEFFPGEDLPLRKGILSLTLLNHLLNELETVVSKQVPPKEHGTMQRWTGHSAGVNLVRYADQFFVAGKSRRHLEGVKKLLSEFFTERGLKFQAGTTKIVHITEGFDFLGWTFRKKREGGMLKGVISKRAEKAHRLKLRETIKNAGNTSPCALLSALTSIRQAWSTYHRPCTEVWKVWSRTNQYLFSLLWRWALKRHPRKARSWVYDHHWKIDGARRTFSELALSRKSKNE